jgi:hypothetical protein
VCQAQHQCRVLSLQGRSLPMEERRVGGQSEEGGVRVLERVFRVMCC